MSNNEFFDTYDLEIEGELDNNNNDNNNVINVDDTNSNISGNSESSSTNYFIFNKLQPSTVWTYYDISSSGNPSPSNKCGFRAIFFNCWTNNYKSKKSIRC